MAGFENHRESPPLCKFLQSKIILAIKCYQIAQKSQEFVVKEKTEIFFIENGKDLLRFYCSMGNLFFSMRHHGLVLPYFCGFVSSHICINITVLLFTGIYHSWTR